MGEVYEGEHIESGRRIALKVLRDRIQNADQRARFLREGQLAASISHPHTVYIFGSEEISGMPVISMELLPGGTLKDRVSARGPLPVGEAVSAILDIIGGLDAAQAAGILHRDIKPSNCFVGSEGAVKVGDFGLSISTLARDAELSRSSFEGTPQFAAPEQLRGEPLDIRADIYAVGATLYYLLTGKTPFEAKDLRELVRRVTSEPAQSPRSLRTDVPPGLASVVLRCLSKSPAERPASYAALADSLRPFSSSNLIPAKPGLRFLASVVDNAVLGAASAGFLMLSGQIFAQQAYVNTWIWVPFFLYGFVLEGIWNTTIGKRLFGLRVATTDGGAVGWWRILGRTTVFNAPNFVMSILLLRGVLHQPNLTAAPTMNEIGRSLVATGLLVAMLSTMRRNNGWAAVHDLASGTRVMARVPHISRREQTASVSTAFPENAPTTSRQYGPFVAVSETKTSNEDRIIVAFDPLLRRYVWIQTAQPGTPAIDPARRDIGREGRLFWLTGKRSDEENWDAYEAPDGEPLLNRQGSQCEWATLKLWLLDLANELTASLKDRSMPQLGLERIWIRGDQRLVLLDFPAPGTPPTSQAALSSLGLLSAVAEHETSRPSSMPLSARALLQGWASTTPPSLDTARTDLLDIATSPDKVARWRRAVPTAFVTVPGLFFVGVALLILPSMLGFLRQHGTMLALVSTLDEDGPEVKDPKVRDALEKYLVGTYGATLDSDEVWSHPIVAGLKDVVTTAKTLRQRHPSVSAEELAAATAVVTPTLEFIKVNQGSGVGAIVGIAIALLQGIVVGDLLITLLFVTISALAFPGGIIMKFVGLAVVDGNGTEISRVRSLIRVGVTWFPAIVWMGLLFGGALIHGWFPDPENPFLLALPLGVLLFGAIWGIARPERGIQDRIMGTWIVPR
jgi:uncharacterized RDD family membrane protein YckC